MRALITGGTGFIGGALARHLSTLGWEVRLLAREISTAEARRIPGCQVVTAELGKSKVSALQKAVEGCDVVFHAGAVRNRWGTTPDQYLQVNVEGTQALIDSCIGCARRFIFVSSVGVYGFPGVLGIDESFPLVPRNKPVDYHLSKVLAEDAVFQRKHLIETVIIRPTITYGPGDSSGMITRLISLIYRRKYIRVGSGQNYIHLIFISDLVKGILSAALSPNAAGQTYNLSGDKPVSFRSLTEQISNMIGTRLLPMIIPQFVGTAAGQFFENVYRVGNSLKLIGSTHAPPITRQMVLTCCANRSFSSQKAKEEIAFENQVHLPEGLVQSVRWMVETNQIPIRDSFDNLVSESGNPSIK